MANVFLKRCFLKKKRNDCQQYFFVDFDDDFHVIPPFNTIYANQKFA